MLLWSVNLLCPTAVKAARLTIELKNNLDKSQFHFLLSILYWQIEKTNQIVHIREKCKHWNVVNDFSELQ